VIAWLNPGALALVALAAVPIVIHLLLRRRATRIAFPSVRFIAASDRSSVRLRRPNDLLLMLVRTGIVALAALAIARPLVLTDARVRTLGQRAIRAIVVDATASVDAERAAEAAAAERQGAVVSRQFAGALPDAIEHAAAWLNVAEPGLREIVVISDFQRGALSAAHLMNVPAAVGLRTIRVARAAASLGTFEAPAVFHEGAVLSRTVRLDEASTAVVLRPSATPSGLDISADPSAKARITRAIASAGALAPSPAQPLRVRFDARQPATAFSAWRRGWAFDVARQLFASPATAGVAFHVTPTADALAIDVESPPNSYLAAEAARTALDARFDIGEFSEQEPATTQDEVIQSWSRAPHPPDISAWRLSNESDGRWLWLAAVALIVAETLLRRTRVDRQSAVEAHAA
jgi:hypothetical protein